VTTGAGHDAAEPGRRQPWAVAAASHEHRPGMAALFAASPLVRRYGGEGPALVTALEAGLAAGDVVLLCPKGDRVLGLAWLILTRALGHVAYLRLLLVAEDQQGSGIGSAVLAAAEGAAARSGAHALVVLATTDNSGARRFYERAGYRHVGDLPGWARPHLDEALYEKRLYRPPADGMDE